MDTQAKTVRLPKDLYQRLRRAAFDRNESQNDIIVAALVTELRRLEREGK
jgi:predicted transcriptional regulator